MVVSTFKYKRPAGMVGQLNLSRVSHFGDRELTTIGAGSSKRLAPVAATEL